MKTKLIIRSSAAMLLAIAFGACASHSTSSQPAPSRPGSDDRTFNAQTGNWESPPPYGAIANRTVP